MKQRHRSIEPETTELSTVPMMDPELELATQGFSPGEMMELARELRRLGNMLSGKKWRPGRKLTPKVKGALDELTRSDVLFEIRLLQSRN